MYAIDYDSLERARAKDRVKALRKVQHNAASACLDEIEAGNPDYYDQLVEAMHEPIGDEQRGRIVQYNKLDDARDPLSGEPVDDGPDEPLSYCYEQQERHGVEGLLPGVDGHYNLPDILGNAIYLLQRLINWHSSDRHHGVTNNPLPGFMDILAGRQIHHRVRAPEC